MVSIIFRKKKSKMRSSDFSSKKNVSLAHSPTRLLAKKLWQL